MKDSGRVSDHVVDVLTGYWKGLLTRGAPPFPSVRQLARDAAQACDLGFRTIQRASNDARLTNLVAQLVRPNGTPGAPVDANPLVSELPPHPDDGLDTSLLLGDLRLFSPGPPPGPGEIRSPAFYTRLRPNDHAGYCSDLSCRVWVDPGVGTILIPYPKNARVPVLCSHHSVVAEVELALGQVKL